MSDKLALSAALSVLMMTAYVLFGGESAKSPLSAPDGSGSTQIASISLPSLGIVLARAGSRHILY